MDDIAVVCQSRDVNEKRIHLTRNSTSKFTFFALAVHSGNTSVDKFKDDRNVVGTRSAHPCESWI
jgi:hypothetical protein